jgi:glyoxylase-like metal-dependent hydrolase (beta-lactamase superfamily II)
VHASVEIQPLEKDIDVSHYEIYAVKFSGPFSSSGAFVMWMKDWEAVVERNYYFWCLKSSDHAVLVDAGVSPELARKKTLANYVNPARLLEAMGVDVNEINHVILTHLHWDHVDGVTLFPHAKIYVQRAERDFWLDDKMALQSPFTFFLNEQSRNTLKECEGDSRMILLDGDRQILPGIECLLAPGHSIALQAVAVNTEKGIAILGSDCAHLFRNYEEEWPSALIIDMVAWVNSIKDLKSRVSHPELLFPGHDPLMTSKFHEIAPGITRLV